MADNKHNNQQTENTAATRHRAIRERLRSRPTPEELVESGAYEKPVPHGLVLDAMCLLGQLRSLREAANLTLAEVSDASGITKPALSRLETGRQDNPTLMTVLRYVHALGKRLRWTLEDEQVQGESARTVQETKENAAVRHSADGNQVKQTARKRSKR